MHSHTHNSSPHILPSPVPFPESPTSPAVHFRRNVTCESDDAAIHLGDQSFHFVAHMLLPVIEAHPVHPTLSIPLSFGVQHGAIRVRVVPAAWRLQGLLPRVLSFGAASPPPAYTIGAGGSTLSPHYALRSCTLLPSKHTLDVDDSGDERPANELAQPLRRARAGLLRRGGWGLSMPHPAPPLPMSCSLIVGREGPEGL